MPVSFSSAARNLFLLGSSGADTVTNFFKAIDKSSVAEDYVIRGIKYSGYDEKYIIAGTSDNPSGIRSGWIDKRNYNVEATTSTEDWGVTLNTTNLPRQDLTLTDIHVDANGKLIAIGSLKTSTTQQIPFISRYTSNGVLEWQSTSNTANVRYVGVASDANGNYYVCGNTPSDGADAVAFVEKFDATGNPYWGKSAVNFGSDVYLQAIDIDSKGYVIAAGLLQDTNNEFKGYFVKLDTNTGDVIWDRTLDITDRDWGSVPVVEINDIKIDGNDFIYIVGSQFDGVSGDSAGYICKYSPEGNMLWQKETTTGAADAGRWRYNCVEADTDTGQIIILGSYFENTSDEYGVLVKYSDKGDKIFTRVVESSQESPPEFGTLVPVRGGMALDASSSFYYVAFTDQDQSGSLPDKYTFGRVSSSGNGLGEFTYQTGDLNTIDYTIQDIDDRIGRLSDGSVRYDTSDLATNILNPTRIMFDDFATPIANKKRQMNRAGDLQYAGSPAIRTADLQDMNLLGDVYSGSGDWLDQSGNGNDADVIFTSTTTTPGTTESENFVSTTSSYSTYGSVDENDTPYSPPSNAWDHYGQKVRQLDTGGFRIDLTGNSTSADFFMGCWIKFNTYSQSRQMGIDLFGDYVYWETLPNGAIAVRHNGGSRADSNSTSLNDGNWHHIALSRTGGTLYGFLDGTAVVSTTSGVSGNSVQSNENFWFFGGSGTAYNTDANILDPIICIGTGTGGYSVPTSPVINTSGIFPNAFPHVPFFSNNWAYISPAVALSGGTVTTTYGPTYNSSGGYWTFDGTDDKMDVNNLRVEELGETFTVEAWIYPTDFAAPSGSPGDAYPRRIMSCHRSNASTKWCIGIDTSGRLGFGGSGGAEEPNDKKYQLSLNTYHHVMLVHDDTEYTLYVDGVERANNTSSPIDAANDTQDPFLCIGGRPNQEDRVFAGRMGEVRAYLRPLTAAAVFQNYNATKSKYINEAPDTAPKIGPGIVYDSNLLLNYDFGNRATYDSAENLLRDNFASGTDTGEYYTDELGVKHKIYSKTANLNMVFSGSSTLGTSGNTYDFVCSFYVDLTDATQFNVSINEGTGAPVGTATLVESTIPAIGTKGIVKLRYTDIQPTSNWYFQVGGFGTAKFARPSLELKPDHGRYIKTYESAITAPTTVKNLSSTSYAGTLDGVAFNSDGYFEFDGTNDKIEVSSSPIAASPTTPFTMEAWAQISTLGSWKTVCSIGGSYTQIAFAADNTIRVGRNGGVGAINTDSGVTAVANTWYHIVGSYDGNASNDIKIYVNGQLEADASMGSNGSNNSSAFRVGSYGIGSGGEWLNGKVGECRLYQTSLSATEVSQNFNATRGKYGV